MPAISVVTIADHIARGSLSDTFRTVDQHDARSAMPADSRSATAPQDPAATEVGESRFVPGDRTRA